MLPYCETEFSDKVLHDLPLLRITCIRITVPCTRVYMAFMYKVLFNNLYKTD